MSIANPIDIIARYDARILGDLVSDDGNRVTTDELLTNPVLQSMLDDGCGTIFLSLQVGQRYTQAQIYALTGTDLSIVVRLNCDLAFCYLCERRGNKTSIYEEAHKRSEEVLKKIKDGAEIFNVASNVGAGVANDTFPTWQNYQTVNTLRTATNYFFPTRRVQNPAIN